MKLTKKQTRIASKHGINLRIYPVKRKEAGVVYVQTKKGHFQEFYDKKSTFLYYVIHGRGVFYLNGKATRVKATDLIAAPPKTRIYYLGKLEMILVTVPAWQPKNEVHVRYIQKPIR
jgi:mannose-6-phosphate isomerase-like protein (cupin superfamily)